MKISKIALLACASVFAMVIALRGLNVAADENTGTETVANLNEMPLLTGFTWQKMTQDEKVAFVWGMGHVATMEREAAKKYPELKAESFAMKLSLGLAGISMNRIVGDVDSFYRDNSGKTSEPVVKVIWDKYVAPKLKTESADLPSR